MGYWQGQRTLGEGYADNSYHEASSCKPSSPRFLYKTVADRSLPQPHSPTADGTDHMPS